MRAPRTSVQGRRARCRDRCGDRRPAGLAAFWGGDFGHEFEDSLWIVGAFMVLLAVFSFSPSTRRGPDELIAVSTGRRFSAQRLDERGGLGLSLTLLCGGLCVLGVAFLNG